MSASDLDAAGREAPTTPGSLLGARLRQARYSRNLTQGELAAGQFSVSYISGVERGQIRPSLGALEKLAARLEVPIDDLMRLEAGETGSGRAPRAPDVPIGAREDVDARLVEAQARLQQGNPEAALRSLHGVPSKGLTPHDEAMVAWRSAEALRQLKREEEARAPAHEALVHAERAGDPELRERVRLELGRALALGGNAQAALDAFRACRAALDAALEQGAILDPLLVRDVLFALGDAQGEAGDSEAAVATLAEAAALAEEALAPARLGARYWDLSARSHDQRDARRARLYAARSLIAYEDAASRRVAQRVMARLGRACAACGRDEDAVAQLEAALERAESQQDAAGVADARAALAGVYLRRGRLEEATRMAEQGIDFASTVDDLQLAAEAQLVLARVLEARGDEAGTQAHFEQAIERLRGVDATLQLGDAYARYSEFLERRGDDTRAFEILKQAWALRERVTRDA